MLSWDLLKPDTLANICADLAEGNTATDASFVLVAWRQLIALVGKEEAEKMIEKAGER